MKHLNIELLTSGHTGIIRLISRSPEQDFNLRMSVIQWVMMTMATMCIIQFVLKTYLFSWIYLFYIRWKGFEFTGVSEKSNNQSKESRKPSHFFHWAILAKANVQSIRRFPLMLQKWNNGFWQRYRIGEWFVAGGGEGRSSNRSGVGWGKTARLKAARAFLLNLSVPRILVSLLPHHDLFFQPKVFKFSQGFLRVTKKQQQINKQINKYQQQQQRYDM